MTNKPRITCRSSLEALSQIFRDPHFDGISVVVASPPKCKSHLASIGLWSEKLVKSAEFRDYISNAAGDQNMINPRVTFARVALKGPPNSLLKIKSANTNE